MVRDAIQHIERYGPTQAYADFSSKPQEWTNNDLYVMVYDAQGTVLAHGANAKLIGRNVSAVKDSRGVPIVNEMLAKATVDGVWLDYAWPDRVPKRIPPKSTFVRRVATTQRDRGRRHLPVSYPESAAASAPGGSSGKPEERQARRLWDPDSVSPLRS